ncbi:cardiotrophin-like cytokine factor 1 isoform X3 [Lutra lutra]|uniref:cardiotrophin-like cytokine factor 1 isoform X3 n=1 Tax=Lutra lutra TaxID=9657 RepID=UPI001FD55AC9|nr:cardiotrophin-like cytokine factor 1 isoform X3 [Lutra lutra]
MTPPEKLGEAPEQRGAWCADGCLGTQDTAALGAGISWWPLAARPSFFPIALSFSQLNYLGPPFNEPDFNPPRLGAETLPRATVNLDVWRSLNDKLRLTQNYEAYSHLLCYLRGLNRQAATAELRRSLAHFCTSLQGLLGSIAGVMAALGYPLPQPLPGTEPTWAPGPAHSDFLQKMDDFWLLKELQTWLWRSAKDFNRLKKKMQPPAAAVTLHLEAHGF